MTQIVIVDDHSVFLEGLSSILSKESNFEILFIENNAIEALKKLKNNQPDLIITDISMPEMNGLEFIKILNMEFPAIKILVLSMFHDFNSNLKIDGFLPKETDKKDLIEAINGICLRNEKINLKEIIHKENLEFKKYILSDREKEIINLIAMEKNSDEIAAQLFISKHTVETHRKNIFLKLNVKNIAGLVKTSMYLGVVK